MKKGKIFGWEKVFSFTLKQLLKSKGNIIMMIIFFLVSLSAYPIMTMTLGNGDKAKTETSIKTLLVSDQTGLELSEWLDITKLDHDKIVLPEKIEYTDKAIIADKDTKKNDSNIDLNEDSNKDTAAVIIAFDENTYSFSFTGIYPAKGNVSKDDTTELTGVISSGFRMALAEHKGISEDQLEYLNADITSETVVYEPEKADAADEEGPKEAKLTSGEYGIVIMILCIVIMLVSLSGEQVASAVLQEKASKLVEFLLTSVQPLALLVGKVVAVFVVTLTDITMLILGLLGSTYITRVLFPASEMGIADTFEKVMSATGDAAGINIQYFMIPVAVLIILFGVLFYSVLAALAGACVSRMEELTEGMKLFTATLIIGSYFGMFVCMTDMISEAPFAARAVAEYFPLSSASFAPSYLILGKMTAAEGMISLAVMIAATALMFMFAAKVYEALIYHKGTPLKIKDLIGIAKNKGGEK